MGLSVQSTREPAAFAAAAREAKLAIVDLRLATALEALDALGPVPVGGPRVVGFIDHERTDVMDTARAKGAEVMAKGQFSNTLPKLLAGLASSPATIAVTITTLRDHHDHGHGHHDGHDHDHGHLTWPTCAISPSASPRRSRPHLQLSDRRDRGRVLVWQLGAALRRQPMLTDAGALGLRPLGAGVEHAPAFRSQDLRLPARRDPGGGGQRDRSGDHRGRGHHRSDSGGLPRLPASTPASCWWSRPSAWSSTSSGPGISLAAGRAT